MSEYKNKYFSIKAEKVTNNTNKLLTEPFRSAEINRADYTDINRFCDLYREAKKDILKYIPSDESNSLDEITRRQFLEDIKGAKHTKKINNLKAARKGLREVYAKEVVTGAMIRSCGENLKVDDAWRFNTLFERNKFSAHEFHGAGAKFQKNVKFLTSPRVNKRAKARVVKDHVEKLMKQYSEMSTFRADDKFAKDFESLIDQASAMESVKNLEEACEKYKIPLDKQTTVKMEALAEFGKAYKKFMTGRAQRFADPVYPEVSDGKVLEYYHLAYRKDDSVDSMYIDGEVAMDQYIGRMQRGFTKLLLAEKELDPAKTVLCIAGKKGVQNIDAVGSVEHKNEPLIIFGPDGKFKSYVDFSEDGTITEQKDISIMALDSKDKAEWRKTKKDMGSFLRDLKSNDSAFRKSSPEYNRILSGVLKMTQDAYKLDAKENAEAILKDCNAYIEKAKAKPKLSNYAKRRLQAVQKLQRSLQTSLTKYNLDKYLAKEKAKSEAEKNLAENAAGGKENEKLENSDVEKSEKDKEKDKEKDNKEKDNKEKDNKEKDVEKTDGKETNGPLTEKTEGIGDPLDDLNLENTKTVDEKKEIVGEKKEIVDKKKESIIEEVDDGFNLIHFSDEEKQIIEHGIEGKDEEDFNLLKDNVKIEKQQEKKSDGVKNQYVPGEENLEGTKLLGEKLKKDITVENKIAENKKSEELSIENEIKNLFPQKGNNNKEKNSLGIN